MIKSRQPSQELREANKQYTLKQKKKLQLIWDLIEIRRKSSKWEFDEALKNKHWSKLAGWDGIDIGLMMAQNIVKEEMDSL